MGRLSQHKKIETIKEFFNREDVQAYRYEPHQLIFELENAIHEPESPLVVCIVFGINDDDYLMDMRFYNKDKYTKDELVARLEKLLSNTVAARDRIMEAVA